MSHLSWIAPTANADTQGKASGEADQGRRELDGVYRYRSNGIRTIRRDQHKHAVSTSVTCEDNALISASASSSSPWGEFSDASTGIIGADLSVALIVLFGDTLEVIYPGLSTSTYKLIGLVL